ncbi:Uncharacterized protein PECH_000489 [Penicillium ucsense]|uniref:Uncharacterized protein n=1 Tax=Penicillium ucsense TaxID=2839758 RepID=A0A8J8WIJ1_9EURO|nr:Uncharacterized protein PECM_004119 [Penicillium ucsense]KAF7733524.1 Uncharacterized protein PECH_000489 [Penicillium ucsense]
MKSFKVLSILGAALVAGAQALNEAPIAGYNIEEFSWEVESAPGSEKVVLNGTVQQIVAQLREINPNFDTDFGLDKADEEEQAHTESQLTKRGDSWLCNIFNGARQADITNGIKYLRGVSGQPTAGPGPGNCARVSCSYAAAIWWCNDNTFTKVLPGFYNIADGAQVLKNQCWTGGGQKFSGQLFHDDKWNVIVRADHDNC